MAYKRYHWINRGRDLAVNVNGPRYVRKEVGRGAAWKTPPTVEPTRMAGDAIPEGLDDLLGEIRDEVTAERQQNKYLAQQLGRFADIDASFERAGVPQQLVTSLQEIGKLANGVPAPYVGRAANGNERRVHTKVAPNPYTGEMEIVPFENARTGEALVTEFGKNVDLEGETKASEYIQDHILRLAGMNPQRGPLGKVDFVVGTGGNTIGIDGQAQQTGRDPVVELFTKVIPLNREPGGYGYGYPKNRWNPNGTNTQSNVSAIKSTVNRLIKQKLEQGIGIKDAVDQLIQEGKIKNDRNILGKLYKADYDKVLMPMQNERQHVANRKARDTIAIAPDAVLSYDLNEIREDINRITDRGDIELAYNAGDPQSRDRQARMKVRAKVPQDRIVDVVERSPYVAQILRQLQ